MASEWYYINATEFCGKVTDGTHDSPKRKDYGKPLITSKHIKGRNIDFENAYLIDEVDFDKINIRSKVEQWNVLISMIGEYCGYCYIERNADIDYAVKNVGIFKTNNELDAKWLYYYLSSPEGKNVLQSLRSGTSQPYLSLGVLRDLPILVSRDKSEMEAIVSVLSALDNKIANNEAINKTAEAIAQAIFKEWFVNYNYPSASGKMQPSQLGDIPEGWSVGKIIDLFVLQRGFDLPTSERTEGKYPVISSSGVSTYHNECKVKGPGVTTGRSGLLGNAYYINQDFWPLNTSLYIKEYKKSTPIYAYHVLRSLNLKDYNGGSAVPTLNRNDVHEIPCIVPDITVINKFDNLAKSLYDSVFVNEKENKFLIDVKDNLIPKLMTGELPVYE